MECQQGFYHCSNHFCASPSILRGDDVGPLDGSKNSFGVVVFFLFSTAPKGPLFRPGLRPFHVLTVLLLLIGVHNPRNLERGT